MIAIKIKGKINVIIMFLFFLMLVIFASGCSENGAIIADISLPANPAITINDTITYTSSPVVQLTLSCETDNRIVDMKISNNPDFSEALWEPYQTTRTWTLSDGYGVKTVYVKYVDEYDTFSEIAGASIEYIDAVTLKVSPSNSQTAVGETVVIDVLAEDAAKLISAYIKLHFDPSIIEIMNITTSGNGFLLSDAGANVIIAKDEYDNVSGTVFIGVLGQQQGFTGAFGNGSLVRITFRGKAAGNSPVTFDTSSEDDFVTYRYTDNAQDFESYVTIVYNGTISIQ